jgi:hypothetical protein
MVVSQENFALATLLKLRKPPGGLAKSIASIDATAVAPPSTVHRAKMDQDWVEIDLVAAGLTTGSPPNRLRVERILEAIVGQSKSADHRFLNG